MDGQKKWDKKWIFHGLASIEVFGIWWMVRKSGIKIWIFHCLASIKVFGTWWMVRKIGSKNGFFTV